MVALNFRTTDLAQWGVGLERDLEADEVDQNFHNINLKLIELEEDKPQPNNIASITVTGSMMTIFLDDGTPIGPLPLPVLQFHWRGAYTQNMTLLPLDTFFVEGVGIYSTLVEHLTPAVFDEDLEVGGDPAYNKLFGADAGAAAASLDYDMGFSFQGLLQDSVDDLLWTLVMPRNVLVSATGAQHRAYLEDAPTTAQQVLPILYNGDEVGTITFAVGQNTGVVALDADVTVLAGERLSVGEPADDDATAANLSLMILGKRLTS